MLKPQITVFTVGAGRGDLQQSWRSLLDQTFTAWEWVLVLDDPYWRPSPDDSRVRIVLDDVAAQQRPATALACSVALGGILAELDRGDRLAPDALAGLADAFADPAVGFVPGGGMAPVRAFRRTTYEEAGGYEGLVRD